MSNDVAGLPAQRGQRLDQPAARWLVVTHRS
jgi:hypothetical protein